MRRLVVSSEMSRDSHDGEAPVDRELVQFAQWFGDWWIRRGRIVVGGREQDVS